MIENTILKANREGRKALVFSMTYKDLWAVEAAAQAGFDAISLDGEHGAFSSSDVDDIVRVANGYGMSVMARVPNIQPNTLNLWLDRGLQGLGRWARYGVQRRTRTAREVQRQAWLRPVDQPEHACAGPDRVEASARQPGWYSVRARAHGHHRWSARPGCFAWAPGRA